jgi:ATP-dependent Clp protease, protease subunit
VTTDPGSGLFDDGQSVFVSRRVSVSGELDDARASELATTLLALDASGDEHIELRLLSARGSLDASLTVIDVLDVLGVEVHGWVLGVVEGGPVGVFAATDVRHVSPHGMLRLHEPDISVAGNAFELERTLASHAARRTQFLETLARRIERPFAEVEAEWGRSEYVDANDAVTLGYAQHVGSRSG